MTAIQSFADRKKDLHERIKGLEAEKTNLVSEVAVLRERLETTLQHRAKTLESEVFSLRAEKSSLEEEVSGGPLLEQSAPERKREPAEAPAFIPLPG